MPSSSAWLLVVAGRIASLSLDHTSIEPPAPPTPAWYGGRVFTTRMLHVGVRPALILDNEDGLEVGVGVTLQVTVGWF